MSSEAALTLNVRMQSGAIVQNLCIHVFLTFCQALVSGSGPGRASIRACFLMTVVDKENKDCQYLQDR